MSFSNNRNAGVITAKSLRTVTYLETMNKVIPWKEILHAIQKSFPDVWEHWWRPRSELIMLVKMTLLQQWYNLSDEAVEENIYDRNSFQLFCDINVWSDTIPDATTLCRFRKHCNEHRLNEKIFKIINKRLEKEQIIVKTWTIMDATIITASWSTKNANKSRDEQMHSTKKWNNYYFWAKAHIGVDDVSWLATAIEFTAANVHDSNVIDGLLHGKEERIYGDSAYYSKARKEYFEQHWIAFNVNKRGSLWVKDEFYNRFFSKTRSKVEHIFWVIKHLRWHRKVRYRWLLKNAQQRYLLLWLANLYKVRNIFAS